MKTSTTPLSSLLSLCGIASGTLLLASVTVSALPVDTKKPAKPVPAPVASINYDRDVRPILSENCFACHGFDAAKRQAGLRLDTKDGAYQKLSSGSQAVVPGDVTKSALVQRIIGPDAIKMPPPSSAKRLTKAQIATLKAWVAQGGAYAEHWAFVPPKRPAIPAVKNKTWVRNPIDNFVLARLEKEGLTPSPGANRPTLIRRLAFDLTGLPPTPKEVDDFVNDTSPNAYEKVVDRLLASPHYGERMALKWLDLARYADTHGYHIDSQRDMYRWRDWVIDAYNKNMPFDEFTIEQLAGDLLPNPTLDQKIATGFNRNHPINFEGGAIPEEYQAAYIFDRIDTTSTVWMGLTLRCSQCHDHKYDPLTQKDFYRFYAFFHNVPEQGLDGQRGNAVPYIKAPYPEQAAQLAEYKTKVAELEQATRDRAAQVVGAQVEWEKTALATLEKSSVASIGLVANYALDETAGEQVHDAVGKQAVGTIKGKAEWAPGKVGNALKLDGNTYVDLGKTITFERTDHFSYGAWVNPVDTSAMTVVSRMDDANMVRGWDMYLGDGKVYIHLINAWDKNVIRVNTKATIPVNQWTHVFATYDGSSKAKGVQVYINGKPAEIDITHDSLTDTIKADKPVQIGRRNPSAPFKGLIDDVRIYDRTLSAGEVAQVAGLEALSKILQTSADKRTKEQADSLKRYYLENFDAPYQKLNTELTDWRKKQTDLDAAIPTTMVMEEMAKPRDTFVLVRGQYDKKGEKVTAAVPEVLEPMKKEWPVNRLGLAKWLVDPSNPLTARVAVNRFWQNYFGYGLVRTAENFGTQGEWPTHPALLDWLSTEFTRTGWDMKAMQKLIVMSATYRQASRTTPLLERHDPENRLLARGPRFRLQAELVRDQALAISGLLVDKIGGPSVKPYQPAGLWEEISFKGDFSAQYYVQDHGEKLYRRAMYTFWKRTLPPPALQTFDAPEREFCMVRRSVTNTPLQALVLMNDPTYVEASRKLAERLMLEGGSTPTDRITFLYRLAMSRPPKPQELSIVLGLFNQQLAKMQKDKEGAMKLLHVGESPTNDKLDPTELAAWAAVSNVVLNLDETLTKN